MAHARARGQRVDVAMRDVLFDGNARTRGGSFVFVQATKNHQFDGF
jgi:hypothetical protein